MTLEKGASLTFQHLDSCSEFLLLGHELVGQPDSMNFTIRLPSSGRSSSIVVVVVVVRMSWIVFGVVQITNSNTSIHTPSFSFGMSTRGDQVTNESC